VASFFGLVISIAIFAGAKFIFAQSTTPSTSTAISTTKIFEGMALNMSAPTVSGYTSYIFILGGIPEKTLTPGELWNVSDLKQGEYTLESYGVSELGKRAGRRVNITVHGFDVIHSHLHMNAAIDIAATFFGSSAINLSTNTPQLVLVKSLLGYVSLEKDFNTALGEYRDRHGVRITKSQEMSPLEVKYLVKTFIEEFIKRNSGKNPEELLGQFSDDFAAMYMSAYAGATSSTFNYSAFNRRYPNAAGGRQLDRDSFAAYMEIQYDNTSVEPHIRHLAIALTAKDINLAKKIVKTKSAVVLMPAEVKADAGEESLIDKAWVYNITDLLKLTRDRVGKDKFKEYKPDEITGAVQSGLEKVRIAIGPFKLGFDVKIIGHRHALTRKLGLFVPKASSAELLKLLDEKDTTIRVKSGQTASKVMDENAVRYFDVPNETEIPAKGFKADWEVIKESNAIGWFALGKDNLAKIKGDQIFASYLKDKELSNVFAAVKFDAMSNDITKNGIIVWLEKPSTEFAKVFGMAFEEWQKGTPDADMNNVVYRRYLEMKKGEKEMALKKADDERVVIIERLMAPYLVHFNTDQDNKTWEEYAGGLLKIGGFANWEDFAEKYRFPKNVQHRQRVSLLLAQYLHSHGHPIIKDARFTTAMEEVRVPRQKETGKFLTFLGFGKEAADVREGQDLSFYYMYGLDRPGAVTGEGKQPDAQTIMGLTGMTDTKMANDTWYRSAQKLAVDFPVVLKELETVFGVPEVEMTPKEISEHVWSMGELMYAEAVESMYYVLYKDMGVNMAGFEKDFDMAMANVQGRLRTGAHPWTKSKLVSHAKELGFSDTEAGKMVDMMEKSGKDGVVTVEENEVVGPPRFDYIPGEQERRFLGIRVRPEKLGRSVIKVPRGQAPEMREKVMAMQDFNKGYMTPEDLDAVVSDLRKERGLMVGYAAAMDTIKLFGLGDVDIEMILGFVSSIVKEVVAKNGFTLKGSQLSAEVDKYFFATEPQIEANKY